MGIIEIAADFESLEVVSAIPAESIGFSPDGRLSHVASLIRAAAWDERCAGIEECTILLAYVEGFTGRLAAIDVKGAVPTLACSSNPAIASRRSSAPAPHEVRIPLGAGAGTSRIRFFGKPICAVPSKTDLLPPLPLDLAAVAVLDIPRSSRSLEEGVAATETDQEGKFSSNWATMPTCSAFHAPVTSAVELIITARHGKRVRKDQNTLLREYCRQQHLVHHCGHLRTLRRVVVLGASLFGEVNSENLSYDDLNDNLQTRAAVKHAGQAEQRGRGGNGAKTKAASDPDARQPAPSCALLPPRSTSRDCRPCIVLSRNAQQWRFGPSE